MARGHPVSACLSSLAMPPGSIGKAPGSVDFMGCPCCSCRSRTVHLCRQAPDCKGIGVTVLSTVPSSSRLIPLNKSDQRDLSARIGAQMVADIAHRQQALGLGIHQVVDGFSRIVGLSGRARKHRKHPRQLRRSAYTTHDVVSHCLH